MYKILRTVLFTFGPEWVHSISMNCLRFICGVPFGKKLLMEIFKPKGNNLPTPFLGILFPNPVGLGAGFDKNANYLDELEALGFGFVEIGTVTPLAQPGNDKPRLFRLPKDKALINRMGFNNEGVKVIVKRLRIWKEKSKVKGEALSAGNNEMKNPEPAIRQPKLIIGGNIGKNKITPNEDAWMDYITCFNALHDYVDYFVVNVSSPNTPGLRELQEKESLRKILTQLQIQNITFESQKPILLKIAPDLTMHQIDDVIELAMEIKLDGIVACNTTISREELETERSLLNKMGAGGLSGLPLKERSTAIIQYIHQKTKGQLPVIASGGIFTGADAKEKLTAGAGLVQVWTGFVYEGPSMVKNICKGITG
ncbi:MAG: quinone-dependent dihydroorotate dehydrogenase [Ferruginibacter sp.]|nr:quinone-dependent dihydroorotate dehydrogenase [Ferruginibacter sp.]